MAKKPGRPQKAEKRVNEGELAEGLRRYTFIVDSALINTIKEHCDIRQIYIKDFIEDALFDYLEKSDVIINKYYQECERLQDAYFYLARMKHGLRVSERNKKELVNIKIRKFEKKKKDTNSFRGVSNKNKEKLSVSLDAKSSSKITPHF